MLFFVPVLNEVAAKMAAAPVSVYEDPERGAYQLREAVSLIRPDWVLTHHDPELEADAVRGLIAKGAVSDDFGDLVDAPLTAAAPVSRVIELVGILAGLYPKDGAVAVSVTGPAGLCSALTGAGTGALDADVLADCGDVLADLVSAYVDAGASRVLVWEPDIEEPDRSEVNDAHVPIVRRLRMLGASGVLCGGAGVDASEYSAHALAGGGRGAVLVPPERFGTASGAVAFTELWREWAAVADRVAAPGAEPSLLVSDGPLPVDCDMTLLRAAGERAVTAPE